MQITFCEKRLLRVLMLAVIAFCGVFLTGCGAHLTVTDYTTGGVRYNMYELYIDSNTVDVLERTASRDADGEKYTVESYFNALFGSFGYELNSATRTSDAYTVSYIKRISGASELDLLGAKQEFEYDYNDTPFVRSYTATAPNPFNGVREKYDDVDPLRATTVLERIKNGAIARDEYGEWMSAFPSIYEAFPAINGYDPDGLLLTYARTGAARMDTTGDKTVIDGGAMYTFTRYFDRSETTVDFAYVRPISYGWYLVALTLGAVTLVGYRSVSVVRNRKRPKMLNEDFDAFA